MVKSLTAIGAAILLLLGVALFERSFVNTQFEEYGKEVLSLYLKTDGGVANAEDAKAVQASWERRKKDLHVWIPHNDIARMDDYLSETVRLIGEKNYSLALAKLEILLHLSECIPGTYRPQVENIF